MRTGCDGGKIVEIRAGHVQNSKVENVCLSRRKKNKLKKLKAHKIVLML